jgi:lipoprotein-anchoring transpeptidase ErfK/SrfK
MSLWQQLQQQIRQSGVDAAQYSLQRPLIHVDISQQRLQLVTETDDVVKSFPISSSRHGLGQRMDSFQTPAGIHRIAQKIGDGEPPGRVFRSRVATDDICMMADIDKDDDVITSRILWLEGLQPGFNQGGGVDSHDRYIYIHGTADEAHIGQPASIGCIRLRNDDVIDLFALVEEQDLVIIE